MSDPGDTKEQLLDAKLDLVRQEMRAGFEKLGEALTTHVAEDDRAHGKADILEERIRRVEIQAAKDATQLKILMGIIGLSGGGLGAFLHKIIS